MITISAFADEIDPDLTIQMDVLASHGIRHIDLRSIAGENVSRFTDAMAKEYRRRMDERGFAVACIGSPLGKIRIDEDLPGHLDLTARCCELARLFGTRYVRIFSFYGPEGGNILDHRAAVMDMLAKMADIAAQAGIILLHENENAIYGARPKEVKDIFAMVKSKNLQCLFDPANFVVEGVRPLEAWNDTLGDLTTYFHMKDKNREQQTCIPVGEGEGQVEPILADAKRRGYAGFLTLEPHMHHAGQFAGFTGPQLFGKAVTALKAMCDRVGLKY